MPVRLDQAKSDIASGRYAAALDSLWRAYAIAEDQNDIEALAEILALAHKISVQGDQASSTTALQIVGGIQSAHAEWLEAADAGLTSMLPMTTGNDLPGYTITEIIGPVFGMTVRSRNVFTQWGAKLKGGTVGGELRGMTEALEQSRLQVLGRMEDRARRLGADAIIAVRFDTSEMADVWTEICAYGTAVRATRD